MSGHLLLVVLLYSVSEIKTQALLAPKLMVNPSTITETDTVTLNCQTPSSVSVRQCFFHIVRGEPAKSFPCLKTLRGTELLKMTRKNSPAEVKVTCFYLLMYESPESDSSFIIIQASLQPKLTVTPPVIKEMDSVALNCQIPSSVSVYQCFFHIVRGEPARSFNCLQILTGTELLQMSHQSSPAVVEVKCYYTKKSGESNSPSPCSDISFITIKSPKPKMSVKHFLGDQVLFTCSLPESENHETRCNLYFGEADHPVMTSNIRRTSTTITKESFCQFTIKIAELLSHLGSVQQSDASCDYSLRSKPNSLSPRSNRSNLKHIVEKESHTTQAMQTLIVTTAASTPSVTETFISTSLTSLNPAPGSSVRMPGTMDGANPLTTASRKNNMWILKYVTVVAGCGVTVGVILLVSAVLWNKKRAAGSEEVNKRKPQTENSDTHHLYAIISEEPAASALKDVMYSTVQKH